MSKGSSPFVQIAIYGGLAVAVIALAIVSGIVLSVLNDGENHKDAMMMSPPPSPPPVRMRAMTEHQEIYGHGNSHFELTQKEKAVFSSLAHRKLMSGKPLR
jgi:hypothetical protein